MPQSQFFPRQTEYDRSKTFVTKVELIVISSIYFWPFHFVFWPLSEVADKTALDANEWALELKFSICNGIRVFQLWQLLYLYHRLTKGLWKSVVCTLYNVQCTFTTVRRSSLSPKYNIVQHDNNYMAGRVIFDITLSDIRSGCHVVPKFLG